MNLEVVENRVQTAVEGGGMASWLAAYTRPRCEDNVRSYCEARGVETFLPAYSSWRRWSDRKKLLQVPLFPSYVFVHASECDRRRVVQAPGFLSFVRNQAGPIQVRDEELEAVRRLLSSGLAYDPLPGVQLGEEVEIVAGVLRGCRGRLLSKKGNAVVLLVSAIQAAVRVSLPDPSWIRPSYPRAVAIGPAPALRSPRAAAPVPG